MIVLLLLPMVIFFPSLTIFFVQDDFFLLSISQAHTVTEFLQFFVPLKQTVWYRPISSQVFFFIDRFVFGLHPFPFHIVVILMHIYTTILIYKLVILITKNKSAAIWAAFFYGTAQIHTIALAWLSAYSFVLGPLCLVMALDYFISKKYIKTYITFIIGLLSSELLFIFPLVIISYQLITYKHLKLKPLVPLFLIIGLTFSLRFIFFPTQITTHLYSFQISAQIITTSKFYFLRLLGLPFFTSGLPSVLKFISILLVIILTGIFVFFLKYLKKEPKSLNYLGFFITWALLGLLPFLFLTDHTAPHYLSFAYIGVSICLGLLVSIYPGKKILSLRTAGLLTYLIIQVIGARWTYQTHWLFQRARLAQKLVEKKQLIHPIGSEEYFSLGANSAAEVIK